MPELETGRRVLFQLPPPLSDEAFAPLEEARESYRRIVQERTVTQQRIGAIGREQEAAERKAREELSKAIRQGVDSKALEAVEKKTDAAITKLDKERKACERRLAAIEEALDESEGALIEVLDEHRSEWLPKIEEEFEEVRSAYEESVDDLAQLRGRVSEKLALWHWVNGFPDTVANFKTGVGILPSLIGRNEEAFSIPQVVAALRDDAQVRPVAPGPRDPMAADIQRLHDERQANLEAGKGYFTDAQLAELDANKDEFWGGLGARRLKRLDRPAANGTSGE